MRYFAALKMTGSEIAEKTPHHKDGGLNTKDGKLRFFAALRMTGGEIAALAFGLLAMTFMMESGRAE